jgi:uncharacterized protein YecT (DUF1311 family)
MLTDRYGLPLSTTSSAARDAYVEGCEAKLTMYPGALEAFDRAIAADPGFALAHAAKAHALLERGDAAAARTSMAAANSLIAGLSAREDSHIAFFDLLSAGDTEAALSALAAHLNAWPRDALVLATTAFTNGLIGSSGRTGQKRVLLELLDRLASSYGDDWWFTAHYGMALSENGQRDAARPKIDRSLAQNPKNPWAAHARAHLCYEEGDPNAARAFLASWLSTSYPSSGLLYSHLSWHLALSHLEAGDAAAALRLFGEAFAPDVHSGPPRGKVNDAVSFLWRWELAGHPRDAEAWRIVHDFANSAFPRAGVAFSDMHIALAQVVAGNDAVLEARARQIDELARKGRYPSGPFGSGSVARLRCLRTARFLRGDRRARTDCRRTRAHRRQPRAARLGRVHVVERLSRRVSPGGCAPDGERAASRFLGHFRFQVCGCALTPGDMFVRANKRDRDDIVRGMLFAVTVLAWMPALPAAAEMFGRGVQPCGDKLHTRIVECIKAKPNAADQRLNTAYKALQARIDAPQHQPLLAAQRLWLQYRDANCGFYGVQDGSIRPSAGSRMHAR